MLQVVLAAQFLLAVGDDPARADAIDPNIGTKADCQRVGERQQSTLGRRIGFGVGLRHQRASRCDGHDRALATPQRALGRTREEEGSREIGVDDVAPLVERESAQGLTDHDARIGDHGIEPLEARH